MPIYEYKCKKCNKIYEKLLSLNRNNNSIPCPDCGEMAFKIISQSNIIYKGSGFASKDLKSTTSSLPSSALSTSTQGGGESGVGHYKETIKY